MDDYKPIGITHPELLAKALSFFKEESDAGMPPTGAMVRTLEMIIPLHADRAAVLREAADAIDGEAWPHERDERENELIYDLAAKLRRMAEESKE